MSLIIDIWCKDNNFLAKYYFEFKGAAGDCADISSKARCK